MGIVADLIAFEAERKFPFSPHLQGCRLDLTVRLSDLKHPRLLLRKIVARREDRLFRERNKLPPFKLLNLGSGTVEKAGWVNADLFGTRTIIENKGRPIWHLDATQPWDCRDAYWEGIFTEHMLEHLTYTGAIAALKEAYRTLQPGAWLRICTPDVRKYVQFYLGNRELGGDFRNFPCGAVALSDVSQNWGHASLWDAELLSAVLAEIGFVDMAEVKFREGRSAHIALDSNANRSVSLYVEARKPA